MSLTRTGHDATAVNSPSGCSESSASGSRYGCSPKNSSSSLCIKCDSSSEISYLDKARHWDSLFILQMEDSEWIPSSDSKPYGCSSQNLSTSLTTRCDSSSDIYSDRSSYWDFLLPLEGEDSEWISDPVTEFECLWDGFPCPSDNKRSWGDVSSVTRVHCNNRSEDDVSFSAEHLLEIAEMEEFSADGPLFWPFEGKFDWNSEESWSSFSISPRRSFVFGSRSTTSRIMELECKQKEDEIVCIVKSEPSRLCMSSKCSAKIVTSECKDEKVVLKQEVPSNKNAVCNEECESREGFSLDEELTIETLVGLKEFDGHEGLDSEFNGDVLC